jgi:hypothetical protein
MVDLAAVRRCALALPGAEDNSNEQAVSFSVRGGKGFAWTWRVRDAPKSPRRPRLEVLAVRCGLERKEMLIDAAPQRFFDDDHYRGYPAVLVRLDAIDEAEFSALLSQAWRLAAPKSLVKRHDAALG